MMTIPEMDELEASIARQRELLEKLDAKMQEICELFALYQRLKRRKQAGTPVSYN